MADRDPVPLFGYSMASFAKAGGFSLRTAKRLVDYGYIHSVKIGGRRVIPADEGARLLERAKTETFDLSRKPERQLKPELKPSTAVPPVKRPISPRLAAHLAKLHESRRAKASRQGER
jgi:hypothetical protein